MAPLANPCFHALTLRGLQQEVQPDPLFYNVGQVATSAMESSASPSHYSHPT